MLIPRVPDEFPLPLPKHLEFGELSSCFLLFMLIDTPSSVCGKRLSVLKETSHNPPKISLAHIAEGVKNVTEESVNMTLANVYKLEIAAFKRVMWQWRETNESGPQKASKEPKEFTTNIPADSGGSFGTTNEEDDHSLMKPLHCTCGRFSSRSEADLQKHNSRTTKYCGAVQRVSGSSRTALWVGVGRLLTKSQSFVSTWKAMALGRKSLKTASSSETVRSKMKICRCDSRSMRGSLRMNHHLRRSQKINQVILFWSREDFMNKNEYSRRLRFEDSDDTSSSSDESLGDEIKITEAELRNIYI